ncbi:hypothetical protein F4781DRAFT_407605 [Annulohypoxylon bovei var. microspora]|nr:hypothetical protein F4781DRAFT_407605 [Annulohypoxylon bovei var. microspora]
MEESGWLLNLDDGGQCPNIQTLMHWRGNYQWDRNLSNSDNCITGAGQLLDQFIIFHTNNNLELFRTKESTLQVFSTDRLPAFIQGLGTDVQNNKETYDWIAQIWLHGFKEAQERYEERQATRIDHQSVTIEGADPKYYAWTCTMDYTVSIDGVQFENYEIPYGSVQPNLADVQLSGQYFLLEPPRLYKWWSGELKSPIYDCNNPGTFEMIGRACKALRDTYRIHKPMSATGTGLHIHIGQEKGWTLLHVKKFTTFWLIFEESMQKIHRFDRSQATYSMPLRIDSPIARAVACYDDREYLSDLRNRNPQLSNEYVQRMNMHVPFDITLQKIPEEIRDMIAEVWQYDTILGLNAGLSGPRDFASTLEFRMMQGTLDFEHIWRWMSICKGIVEFSRDSTPQQFQDAIRNILTDTIHPAHYLGVPVDYFQYFVDRQNPSTGFFEYPDADRVNWTDPFMARGYGDVYTGQTVL